jgi:hypothetical protein
MYIKVKNNKIIKFPYTINDLKEDNPFTNYDNRYDVKGWFDKTETALKEGYELVKVEIKEKPDFDKENQHIVLADMPALESGK